MKDLKLVEPPRPEEFEYHDPSRKTNPEPDDESNDRHQKRDKAPGD